MFHSRKRVKNWGIFLNFSVFAGIVPVGISGVVVGSFNGHNRASDLTALDYSEQPLKFTDRNNVDYYVSLRSNPMNNFVSLTTENKQYTYALCDTAKNSTGIRYAYNSGVAKFDSTGKLVDLWIMPTSGNDNLYTTNIVFGDNENTLYVLAGIRNPAKALNDVYGNANVPTKINYDSNASPTRSDTAYFIRRPVPIRSSFERQPDSKYKVDITNYRFDTYTPIKIFKLNASNLGTAVDQYKFEFPPAAVINGKDGNVASEYDKTIIAGFGGGQHLNYWSTNATFIANYGLDGRSSQYGGMSTPLMNSSFFHYLQYGQTFDYAGNNHFWMIPKYIGIDPNLGGLYSLVSEVTGSLASLSNYMSLYDALWRYMGKPGVNNKTIDFNSTSNNALNYQYEYLDGSGKVVWVDSNSEFALKNSVIFLILLSIGYFLSSENGYVWQSWNGWGTDITQIGKDSSVPASMLSNYGIIDFNATTRRLDEKYRLYLFTRYLRNFSSNWYRPGLLQYTFDNMFVTKGSDGKKRYAFYLKSSHWGDSESNYSDGKDYYNYAPNDPFLYGLGTANGSDYEIQRTGITSETIFQKYTRIAYSQSKQSVFGGIKLTGVNANSYDWSDNGISSGNYEYYNNCDTIFSYSYYDSNGVVLGFNSIDAYDNRSFFRSMVTETKTMDSNVVNGMQYAAMGNSSGSKYVVFRNKVIMSDPVWLNVLTVFDANDLTTMGKNYSEDYLDASNTIAYQYAESAKSPSSYKRISTLFLLPDDKGFGYMDYTGRVYLCENSSFPNVLTASSFKLLNKLTGSFVTSFVPIGDKFFVSVLDSNGMISNWIYGEGVIVNPPVDNPGTDNPGNDNPGNDNPGNDNPGTDNPGNDNPGADNPGNDNPGTDNPGADNPGTDNPGTGNPGNDNPGTDNPGTDNPIIDGSGSNNSSDSTATTFIIVAAAITGLIVIFIFSWVWAHQRKLKNKMNKKNDLSLTSPAASYPAKYLPSMSNSNSPLYPVPYSSYGQSRWPVPVRSSYSNRFTAYSYPYPTRYNNDRRALLPTYSWGRTWNGRRFM